MKALLYSHEFKRYFKINRNISKVTLRKEWKTIIR
jgi:RNA-directed DNA polymerase